MFIGVQLFRTTGDWNLAEILAGTSLAWLGHLFLAISLLGPALSTIHSGGLAWKHVLPISQQQGAVLLILVGLGLGLVRFDRQLLLFLDWVAAVAPPAVVTIIAATALRRRGTTELALVAWIAGALVGLGFKINGQLAYLAAGASTSLLIFCLGQMVRSGPRFSKE